MAATGKHALLNVWLRANGVDLSDHVQDIQVNDEADDVKTTAMGQYGTDRVQGIKDASVDVTFYQDFASAKVHATLQPLYASGTSFTLEWAPDGSTISATNPKGSATCILLSYPSLGGAVGDANTTKVTFPVKGTIAYATA